MSSSVNDGTPVRPPRNRVDVLAGWNRRLHYYIGLYLLFFCWLFAFAGLLLNHPRWEFAQFWPNRVQSSVAHEFQTLNGSAYLTRARELMQQLAITGEIQWPARQSATGPFTFQVSRPGEVIEVRPISQWDARRCSAPSSTPGRDTCAPHIHGVRSTDPANDRDWILTTVWALTMDVVAVGFILMVFSSYVMWLRLAPKRRGGIVALSLGILSSGLFVVGLRWLA
jgi:hypothetical protein